MHKTYHHAACARVFRFLALRFGHIPDPGGRHGFVTRVGAYRKVAILLFLCLQKLITESCRQTFLRVAFWDNTSTPCTGRTPIVHTWNTRPSLFSTPRQSHSSVRSSGRWGQSAKVGEVWFQTKSRLEFMTPLFRDAGNGGATTRHSSNLCYCCTAVFCLHLLML